VINVATLNVQPVNASFSTAVDQQGASNERALVVPTEIQTAAESKVSA
jgi:hypothetical protein